MKISELFEIQLAEARRNPHLNPKVSPIDTFSLYGRNKKMFVSYTKIPKLGVNPQSNFNTPIGVYSYPLDYVLERAYQRGTIFGAAPYAARADYVHLFEQTSNKVLELVTYQQNDYNKDREKLIRYVCNKQNIDESDVRFFISLVEADYNRGSFKWGKRIWFLVYRLAKKYFADKRLTITTYEIFHKVLGYDAAVDRNDDGIIHSSEPTQAVHFNPRTIKVISTFDNIDLTRQHREAFNEFKGRSGRGIYMKMAVHVKEFRASAGRFASIVTDYKELGADISVKNASIDSYMSFIAYGRIVFNLIEANKYELADLRKFSPLKELFFDIAESFHVMYRAILALTGNKDYDHRSISRELLVVSEDDDLEQLEMVISDFRHIESRPEIGKTVNYLKSMK